MKKTILLFFALCAIGLTDVKADELESLFRQRDQMFQNVQQHYKRNSAFLGGKSKRDLERIIRELENIVDMDNRIINVVQEQRRSVELERDTVQRQKNIREYVNFQLESTLFDMNRRVVDLENANRLIQDQLNRSRAELQQSELRSSKHKRNFGLLLIISILSTAGFSFTGILLYRKIKEEKQSNI